MKRLLVKFFVFFVLITGTLLVLNFFYTKTDYWKYQQPSIEKFKNVPNHIQLANLGSSHGTESFDYTDVSYRTFNFAISAQLYLYDYAILRQYIDNFEKDAVLIILIEYFEIIGMKTDFKDQLDRYLSFLDTEFMPKHTIRDYVEYAIRKTFPVLYAGSNITKIWNDIDIETRRNARYSSMPEAELIDYCRKKSIDWAGFITESGEEGYAYNMDLVCRMIELCMSHDIRPVLVATPIVSILNNIYAERSPDFFDTYYRFTREIGEKYPGIRFFDYSHDDRFENDFSLFQDSDHLNAYGAEKFTQIVVADLEASGIIIH